MIHTIIIILIYIISFIISTLNGNEWYFGLIGGLIISVIYAGIIIFYFFITNQIKSKGKNNEKHHFIRRA